MAQTLLPGSIPIGINQCPIHKCWIKKQQLWEGKQRRETLRYCPVCFAQEHAAKSPEEKQHQTIDRRKITL